MKPTGKKKTLNQRNPNTTFHQKHSIIPHLAHHPTNSASSTSSTNQTDSPCLTDSSLIHPHRSSKSSSPPPPPSPSAIPSLDQANPSLITPLNPPTHSNYTPSLNSIPTSQNPSFSYHHQLSHPSNPLPPKVHRCRFIDHTPASITAIASSPPSWDPNPYFGLSSSYDHPSSSSNHRGVLAVGRGNGDIEIWIWVDDQHSTKHSIPVNSNNRLHKKPLHSSSSPKAWSLYRTLPGHLPSIPTHPTHRNPNHQSTSKVEHLLFAHQIIPTDPDPHPDHLQSLARRLPRLIGSNGADEVLEWDWEGPRAGTIKRTLPMPASVAVWSLSVSPGSTRLAIGCDDGVIRLANIADDQFELIRRFDPCKTRLLSIAWGVSSTPPSSSSSSSSSDPSSSNNINHPDRPIEPPDTHLYLVTGCADSSLRKWSVHTGRCVNRMTVEKLQGEQTLVWSVTVVNDTIVSGDSLGNIHFWDPRSCSRRQTIRAHRADVLCIVSSPDGNSIFTSGVDQKTCQLTMNIQSQQKSGLVSQSRWLLSASRRLHSHDVRALEMSPPYNPLYIKPGSSPSTPSYLPLKVDSIVPVLISGGLDMSLVLCPAAPPPSALVTNKVDYSLLPNPISDSFSVSFADSMYRKISYVTKRDPVVQTSKLSPQLLVCRNSQSISIWQSRPPPSSQSNQNLRLQSFVSKSVDRSSVDREPGWKKVVMMDLKCRTNLINSAISPDGRWFVASDLYEVKLFYLKKKQDGEMLTVRPRKVKGFQAFGCLSNPKSRAQGGRCIQFTADSTRLILVGSLTSDLVVLGLSLTDDHHDHQNNDDGDGDGDDDVSRKIPTIKVLKVFYQHTNHRLLDQCQVGNQDQLRSIITPTSLLQQSIDGDRLPNSVDKSIRFKSLNLERDLYIMSITISPDGQWLATADSTRTLHIFNLDSLKHHCYLPMPSLVVNSLAFPAGMPSVLMVGFPNNTIQVIDVESRKVPEWAIELMNEPPSCLTELRDSMIGITFEPLKEDSSIDSRSSSNSLEFRRSNSSTNSKCIDSSTISITPTIHHHLEQSKDLVGLIWGANWVCKITIQHPDRFNKLQQLQNIDPPNDRHNNRKKKRSMAKDGDLNDGNGTRTRKIQDGINHPTAMPKVMPIESVVGSSNCSNRLEAPKPMVVVNGSKGVDQGSLNDVSLIDKKLNKKKTKKEQKKKKKEVGMDQDEKEVGSGDKTRSDHDRSEIEKGDEEANVGEGEDHYNDDNKRDDQKLEKKEDLIEQNTKSVKWMMRRNKMNNVIKLEVSNRYQSLLLVEYLNSNELVIVERPLLSSLISSSSTNTPSTHTNNNNNNTLDQLPIPVWSRVGVYAT